MVILPPPDILILVEVSDATLVIDRNAKLTAYAMAGIKEYWLVNLKGQKLELHLNPVSEEGVYASVSHHGAGETFTSPFAGTVAVDELLVPAEEE